MKIDSIFSRKTERNKAAFYRMHPPSSKKKFLIIIIKTTKKNNSAGNYTSDTTVERNQKPTNKHFVRGRTWILYNHLVSFLVFIVYCKNLWVKIHAAVWFLISLGNSCCDIVGWSPVSSSISFGLSIHDFTVEKLRGWRSISLMMLRLLECVAFHITTGPSQSIISKTHLSGIQIELLQ